MKLNMTCCPALTIVTWCSRCCNNVMRITPCSLSTGNTQFAYYSSSALPNSLDEMNCGDLVMVGGRIKAPLPALRLGGLAQPARWQQPQPS